MSASSANEALPPAPTTPDFEDFPNVLADRTLQLHSRTRQQQTEHDTKPSLLHSIGSWSGRRATAGDDDEDKASALARDESESLLGNRASDDLDTGRHRSAPGRSHSLPREDKLAWYKTPSPLLLMPGTLIFALSLGMTASAKIDIYNQLICREMYPDDVPISMRPAPTPPRQPSDPIQLPPPSPSSAARVALQDDPDIYIAGFVTQALDSSRAKSEEDSWKKRCHASPEVVKSVSFLATVLNLIMGCLSALTTGWYGSISDRYGRRPILTLALTGMCLMDIVFLFTVSRHDLVGYRFLLVGPLLDGCLGGFATASATMNAYISDTTEPGSRARVFSVIGGLMFGGFAVGPILGALLLRSTHSTLFPFWIALGMHLTYLLSVVIVIPESLSKERQRAARQRRTDDKIKRREDEKREDVAAREQGRLWRVRLQRLALRPWGFLKPLQMLLPRKRLGLDEKEEDRPVMDTLGPVKTGWDFSLVKIGLTMACFGLFMAMIQFKMIYAQTRFDWDAEQLGYFLSFLGGGRVIVLLGILPLAIKKLRKPPPLPPHPRPEHDTAGDPTIVTDEQKTWDKEATWLRVVHDSHFDLRLAQFSIVVEMIAYIFMALNGGASGIFLAATALSCLGGGASAAIQSLALAHASPRDAGRLFACLSVLSSLSSSILGPILFGTVFYRTAATRPETIFWVAVGVFALALCSMLLIRLRKSEGIDEEARAASAARMTSDALPPRQAAPRRRERTTGDESAYSLAAYED